jgi:hypothetical protein
MLTFNKRYFAATVVLFAIELFIGIYVRDRFIRPYVGDVLVVGLIYCFVKTFLKTPVVATAIGVLLFSFLVEVLQYFKIVHWLGLQDNKLASIVIGTAFAWADMLAYIVGAASILLVERFFSRRI